MCALPWRRAFVRLTALACLPAALALARQDPPPEQRDRLRAAVERSLPLMQASMQTWIERTDCLSCHHQALGTMAVVLARERGFAIDAEPLARQVDGMARNPAVLADALQGDAGINGTFGRGYQLLALAAAGHGSGERTDALVHYVAGNASDEGAWLSESHRPPLEDSPVSATALALRALSLWAPAGRAAEIEAKVARARAWLEEVEPASSEEHSLRLLGLFWSGASSATVASAARVLAARQRPDGGWAQIETRASDAYATGQGGLAFREPHPSPGSSFGLTLAASGNLLAAGAPFGGNFNGRAYALRLHQGALASAPPRTAR